MSSVVSKRVVLRLCRVWRRRKESREGRKEEKPKGG